MILAQWETSEEIQFATAAAGFPASPHQLRRWRGMGLLPDVRQVGRGRSTGGSDTRHPVGTAAQAIAIGRLLAEKEKLTGVGWKLWMNGFPVREDHWRAPIEKAHATLRRCTEIIRNAVNLDDRRGGETTIYDLVDFEVLRGTPIYAAMMRLPVGLRGATIRVAADVLLGRFKVDGASGKPFDQDEMTTVNKVLGLSVPMPNISGKSLNFSELPEKLERVSAVIGRLNRSSLRVEEPPIGIRSDLLNAQAIAIDLYHSTAWLFKGGFNLRTLERIIARESQSAQAMMLIVWNRYRPIDPDLESFTTVATMAQAAGHLRDLADKLQQVISDLPNGHILTNKTKLRRLVLGPRTLQ